MPHPGVLQTEVQPSDGWARLLGGFVTVFAVWTAYCHALVYAAADFHLLLSFSLLPLAVSVVLIRYQQRLRLLSLGP